MTVSYAVLTEQAVLCLPAIMDTWDDYRVALPISSIERVTYKELQQTPGYKD